MSRKRSSGNGSRITFTHLVSVQQESKVVDMRMLPAVAAAWCLNAFQRSSSVGLALWSQSSNSTQVTRDTSSQARDVIFPIKAASTNRLAVPGNTSPRETHLSFLIGILRRTYSSGISIWGLNPFLRANRINQDEKKTKFLRHFSM